MVFPLSASCVHYHFLPLSIPVYSSFLLIINLNLSNNLNHITSLPSSTYMHRRRKLGKLENGRTEVTHRQTDSYIDTLAYNIGQTVDVWHCMCCFSPAHWLKPKLVQTMSIEHACLVAVVSCVVI